MNMKLSKCLPSMKLEHLSFIRNVWINVTPSASVTLPFTYPHILTLLTSNSLLSMMIVLLASVIQRSLTYPHVPDEAQINNHQASYLASIRLIFIYIYIFLLCDAGTKKLFVSFIYIPCFDR